MVLRILKNPYVIAALVVFAALLGIFLTPLNLTLGESLFGSVALTAIGVGGI